MNGIKIVSSGNVGQKDLTKFSVDSDHPFWLCAIKPKPKHYGFIRCTITSITPGATRTILSINPRYLNLPSFITQWYFPAGTHPGHSDNQQYGIGSFEAFVSGTNLVSFNCKMTGTLFTIEVTNGSASTLNNIYVEFRYYIFAQALDKVL